MKKSDYTPIQISKKFHGTLTIELFRARKTIRTFEQLLKLYRKEALAYRKSQIPIKGYVGELRRQS